MDVLSQLRLKGSIFLHAEFYAPWGIEIPKDHSAILHIVTAGSCWLTTLGYGDAILLSCGDLVLFPRGHAHCLLHSMQGIATPASKIFSSRTLLKEGPVQFGGTGMMTRFLCGEFQFDKSADHPLIESLPDMIHIKSSESQEFSWLLNASYLLQDEAESVRPGSSAIMDRLSEVIFSQILRVYMETSQLEKGFFAALKDGIITNALQLIHRQSERKWTIAELAKECGTSRSGLADRFKHAIGETPITYLTRWRIQKAQDLLEQSRKSTAQIAEEVGYQSESAFAIAFKKITGKGPGQFRREHQAVF